MVIRCTHDNLCTVPILYHQEGGNVSPSSNKTISENERQSYNNDSGIIDNLELPRSSQEYDHPVYKINTRAGIQTQTFLNSHLFPQCSLLLQDYVLMRLFIYLLVMCLCSLENHLFKSLDHFFH